MGRASVTVPSKMKKEISIQDLERLGEKGSVYVVNNSPRGQRGDIMFSAPKMNGSGADIVKVAKTWIPQDLTDQVTKNQLLASSEFRKTVQRGYLKIVNAEWADLVLQQNDAQEEVERLANLRSAARNIMRAKPVTEDDDEPQTATTRRRKRNQAASVEDRGDAGGVTVGDTGFQFFLQSLEGKSETAILNMLKSEGSFSKRELKQIQASFGELPRIANFVEKRLNK